MGRPRKSAKNPDENITVLDVKPVRTLAPMFPAPQGFHTYTPPNNPSFVCVTPFGAPNAETGTNPPGFASGQIPQFPQFPQIPSMFFQGGPGSPSFSTPTVPNTKAPKPKKTILNPTPIQAQTPISTGGEKKRRGRKRKSELLSSPPTSTPTKTLTPISSNINHAPGSSTTTEKKKRGRKRKQQATTPENHKISTDITVLPFQISLDPRESVEEILMSFDALRRRILQLDEVNQVKNAQHLKAGSIMLKNNFKINREKTVGNIPGVQVGDMYYFRMEMCLIGLNNQTMSGIDYDEIKFGEEVDRVAISIVSSGVYENTEDDVDTLIYSGQGASTKDDQKLIKGNLALQKSVERENLVRVVRSVADYSNPPSGKIYVYDGLYKIKESWTEKAGSGFNVFKYKLFRETGQPEGIAIWKKAEKWRNDPASRGKVVVADISNGLEPRPVCLVNEVDQEKGPTHFTYATKVLYKNEVAKNPNSPSEECKCASVCLPGDLSCACAIRNGDDQPYSAQGVLVRKKNMIFECGVKCGCSINCRNRLTQKGIQFHFEVFKTENRGWGLRSWEPIRAGTFICEYIGEVMEASSLEKTGEEGSEEDEYLFKPVYSDQYFKWNRGPELLGEPSTGDLQCKEFGFVISAKNNGNVARFMNHSCSPNVFWQAVSHDCNGEAYPHVCFFATKHIPPLTELTFDYGKEEGANGKKCLCGSPKCRGVFG